MEARDAGIAGWSPGAKRLIAGVALLGFAASLVVNVATFLGFWLAPFGHPALVLHLGIFPVGCALMLAVRAEHIGETREVAWRNAWASIPRWGRALLALACLYFAVTFVVDLAATDGGQVTHQRYDLVLESHARVLRHLTREEASEVEVQHTRSLSALWMVFYVLPPLHLLPRRQERG